MRRAVLLAIALGALALPASASAVEANYCGGGPSFYTKQWAGAHTSCAMARATASKVRATCGRTGECPVAVRVTSPTTHRSYRMRLIGRTGEVAIWTGRGDRGSTVTVLFWMP